MPSRTVGFSSCGPPHVTPACAACRCTVHHPRRARRLACPAGLGRAAGQRPLRRRNHADCRPSRRRRPVAAGRANDLDRSGRHRGVRRRRRPWRLLRPAGRRATTTPAGRLRRRVRVRAPRAQAGDRVHLTGRVDERYGRTQFTLSGGVTVCARGQTVTPATLTLPVATPAVLAALEGMRVRLPQTLTVSDTHELGRYGSVVLSHGRLRIPTHVAPPAEAAAIATANARNRIVLDDGSTRRDPATVRYPPPALSAANTRCARATRCAASKACSNCATAHGGCNRLPARRRCSMPPRTRAPRRRPGTRRPTCASCRSTYSTISTATGVAAVSMPRPTAVRKRPPRSRGRRRRSSPRCARCVPT